MAAKQGSSAVLVDEMDRGLSHDLSRLRAQLKRRQVLHWLGGAGLAGAAGCSGVSENGECAMIPEETAGPYPGDGTNGQNALTISGIVRNDIRASIGEASGVAEGIALTITLKVIDGSSCDPLAGYAVYLWHCNREGEYSMYTGAAEGENYLRGVQESDENGEVTFTSIFPACYDGRWPHIHFEVYESVERASSGDNAIVTSQLALPSTPCDAVYATSGHEASVQHFAKTSLDSDNVFSDDGAEFQIAEVSGDVGTGFTASLSVGV
jgi:protocatechuate 3,4-dioxygenase beta subunit